MSNHIESPNYSQDSGYSILTPRRVMETPSLDAVVKELCDHQHLTAQVLISQGQAIVAMRENLQLQAERMTALETAVKERTASASERITRLEAKVTPSESENA